MKASTPKGHVPAIEAAEMIGCSLSTLYRLIDAGELEEYRFTDRGWRKITVASVKQYLASRHKARKTTSKKTSRRTRK